MDRPGKETGPSYSGGIWDEEMAQSAALLTPLHFCVERMMRFTNETDMPNVRAIVAGFSPALNDARMRFAFPSGIRQRAWFQQATILVGTR